MRLTDLSIRRLPFTEQGQLRYFDDLLPGFGITVGKRTKTFIVVHGKTRKLQTLGKFPATTLQEARDKARLIFTTPPSEKPAQSYPDAYTDFLKASRKKNKKKTADEYERYFKFFEFKCRVPEITKKMIEDKLEELAKTPTAQNYAFVTMRAFFNWCIEKEIIDRHPLARMKLPNKSLSRDKVLTDDEVKKIWDATNYEPFGHMVRCLLLSGQRRMEIAGLTESQIDEHHLTFPDTKNNQPHVIPLTTLLKEHVSAFGIPTTYGWSKAKKALDKSSQVSGWTLHDLRRYFSTTCARLEIPLHVTERILNHQTGTVSGVAKTYNRYGFLKEMESALLRYEEHIRTIVGLGQ